MAGYHGMSDYTKTALVVLLLTSIVHIVSYGAPYWTTRHNGNAGLWTGCTDGICYERWNQWVASEYANFSDTQKKLTSRLKFAIRHCIDISNSAAGQGVVNERTENK